MAEPVQCATCGQVCLSVGGLKRHRVWKHPPEVAGPIHTATLAAINDAGHLTTLDKPITATALKVARQLDGSRRGGRWSRLAGQFLDLCESLGLTPVARGRLRMTTSKLTELRTIHRSKR